MSAETAIIYRLHLAWERRRLAVSEWWYCLRHLDIYWAGDLTAHWEPTAEMAGSFWLPAHENGSDRA